tara:strand:- start:275 stop:937 length:663 start_codon:yes stop_codon:yes gene_type:complete
MKIKIIPEEEYTNSIFVYIPNFLTPNHQKQLLQWLEKDTDFKRNPKYTNKGFSRFQKWHQKNNLFFCPAWNKRPEQWKAVPYTDKLLYLQNFIQDFIDKSNLDSYGIHIPKINSCLINKYRDGNDYIRPHRDTEKSFGEEPTIIGLSLGSPRDLLFRRVQYNKTTYPLDRPKQHLNFAYRLEPGSLYIMAGSSQRFFSHEVPKTTEPCSCRYSLTFREYI